MLHLISEEASADLEDVIDYFLSVSIEAGNRLCERVRSQMFVSDSVSLH